MTSDLSLTQLADAAGIEARTIRSYIERGLLAGAQTRGRGATYSAEHLERLQVIQAIRRARPNISLGDIRILLQQLKPEQIHGLASGSITAAVLAIDESACKQDDKFDEGAPDDARETRQTTNWEQSAARLTGAERVVRLLREVSHFTSSASTSRMEGWQRISVTPDIELSVRAEFDEDHLATFRDLADLLRHLLQRTDALTWKGDE